MSWESLIKARGNSPRKLDFVERYGLDTENFYSIHQVLANMKQRKGGFMAGQFNTVQLRGVLDKLVRQGRAEGRPITIKRPTSGNAKRPSMEYRQIVKEISKSDWRATVDNLVTKDTPFEIIYDNIRQSMKFDSPSRGDVLKYLNENYDRHKLWSNLWSVRKILKAKVKAVRNKRYYDYVKFIKKILKDEGGAAGMKNFIDAGNKIDGFDEKYLKYVIGDAIDHDDWLSEHEHGDYYLTED
tara:strand:- start:1279 stop:2001 length:723 start_codon:yes stop_codon:yes gene_type:complete